MNILTVLRLLLLLLFTISTPVLTSSEEVLGKERKNILERISSSVSKVSDGRTRRADNINKGFEWIIRCVNILGQVDNFISDRTRNVIRKLHTMYNEDDADRDVYRNFNQRKRRKRVSSN